MAPKGFPTLVIVSGLPATGKSTLARDLRSALDWPLIAKDTIKESLADALPASATIDRARSQEIGKQAITALLVMLRELLETHTSCVVEGNFLPWLAADDLAPFFPICNARQVHCSIPGDLVLKRYRERAEAGVRHRVHADYDAIDDLARRIKEGGGDPLPLDIPLLDVNTLDGFDPGLATILDFCRS